MRLVVSVLLTLVFSGCSTVTSDEQGIVIEAPTSGYSGSYTLESDPHPLDSNAGDALTLHFELQELPGDPEDRSKRVLWTWIDHNKTGDKRDRYHGAYLLRDGERIAGALRWSTGEPGSYGDQKDVRYVIPDAWDLPSHFGLGPILGERLIPGETVSWDLWYPGNTTTLDWRLQEDEIQDEGGCVRLEPMDGASPKTQLPATPFTGDLVACEGQPVPVLIRLGDATLELNRFEAHPPRSYQGPTAFPSGQPRPLTGEPRCVGELPASGDRTLNIRDYEAWAREEDPAVRSWFSKHPDGQILPAYGRYFRQPPAGPLVSNSYDVDSMLVLYDPASGALEARVAVEDHTETLFNHTSRYEPSEDIVDGYLRPRGFSSLDCPGPATGMDQAASAIVERMGPDPIEVGGTLGPELGAGWQGTGRLLRPMHVADAEDDLIADPAYPRLYVSLWPTPEDGRSFLLSAAVDPYTATPLWFEQREN